MVSEARLNLKKQWSRNSNNAFKSEPDWYGGVSPKLGSEHVHNALVGFHHVRSSSHLHKLSKEQCNELYHRRS